jgi:hypothetical protein
MQSKLHVRVLKERCLLVTGASTLINREVPRIIPGIDSTDPQKAADYHLDATLSESWAKFPDCDWICTNTPYAEFAAPIIRNAYQKARVGVAAFLLTSFLEPCDDRADFLQQHPPSLVLILPRFCFRKDKKGKRWATDNITISCFVWDKRTTDQRIIVRPANKIAGFYKNPDKVISQESALSIIGAIANGEISTYYQNSL